MLSCDEMKSKAIGSNSEIFSQLFLSVMVIVRVFSSPTCMGTFPVSSALMSRIQIRCFAKSSVRLSKFRSIVCVSAVVCDGVRTTGVAIGMTTGVGV